MVNSNDIFLNGYDVQPLQTYWYFLDQGPEVRWDGFNQGVRKVIITAQKRNLSVESGGVHYLALIYDLLDMRNQSSSLKALLLDIVRSLFSENCSAFIAKLDRKVKSGVIIWHFGQMLICGSDFPDAIASIPVQMNC